MKQEEVELIRRLMEAFNMEAEERLADMSSRLLELEKATEKSVQDPLLADVFREAHSLKGAARAVNLRSIEGLCQTLEDVFTSMGQGGVPLSPELFDIFHQAIEVMEKFLAAPDKEDNALVEELADTDARLLALAQGDVWEAAGPGDTGKIQEENNPPEAPEDEAPSPGETRVPARMEQNSQETGPEAEINLPAVGDENGSTVIMERKKPQAPESVPESPQATVREMDSVTTRQPISESVKISTFKLDSVLLKAEELLSVKLVGSQHSLDLADSVRSFANWEKKWTEARSELRDFQKKLEKQKRRQFSEETQSLPAKTLAFLDWNENFVQTLNARVGTLAASSERNHRSLGRFVDDLLDGMKEMTMLPFSALCDGFPRMVRDISRQQGKEVDLKIVGAEIEIDRRILEEMRTPFIHLLRNAIDHGLESPKERARVLKPNAGRVDITISQTEGGRVEILIEDDGQGVNPDRIRKEAVKRNVVTQKEADFIDDQEAMSLIFRSEFSTSPIITEISGRGLGLAIVSEAIEKLGGLISLDTKPGLGTSFRVQLPVSLATFRGVLVTEGERSFILPCSQVERVLRIESDVIKTVESKATIPLMGRALPYVELTDVLGLDPDGARKNAETFLTVMILGSGEKRIAFRVDGIVSEQEVVVKSLGRQLSRVPNIAGATILGSGEVVPVLNVHDLLKSSLGARARTSFVRAAGGGEKDEKKSILVAEDSLTARMLIKNILEAAGYAVRTAVDGQDAFTVLKEEGYDAVVSDVEMPRMNGFELTERIRSDAGLAQTPVVLVTSLDSREDKERGIDVGANAYIIKSGFNQSNLLEVIDRLI